MNLGCIREPSGELYNLMFTRMCGLTADERKHRCDRSERRSFFEI